MKVAVMGAGAVGCYYGALLARAGHEVCFIGRPQHVEAIRQRGLILEIGGTSETVSANAMAAAAGVADADLILFCVKSTDTMSAGRDMAAHVKRDAAIVSLQNGVDNPERLQALLGREVIPAAVYVATDMPAPGHVRHHGRGELIIGASAASAEIAEAFAKAGVPTNVSDEVMAALWVKLIVNCAYNALSAIAQLPYGKLIQVDGVVDLMRDVVRECVEVATRCGTRVPDSIFDDVRSIAATMPNQYSSTAQDIARGRPTEIEHLNGYVVRKGLELGIATPANRALLVATKLIEAKART
jgi:2-dehydropantoate 2-reductase